MLKRKIGEEEKCEKPKKDIDLCEVIFALF